MVLENNPEFLVILRGSRESCDKHGGLTSDEVRPMLGLERKRRRKTLPRLARGGRSR